MPHARRRALTYDEGVVINAAMRTAVESFFSNTGPTGQRAMGALGSKLSAEVAANLPQEVVARSEAHGKAIADHVIAWSASDGGAVIENMGFPYEYTLTAGPGHWVPTSPIKQQQVPLLPGWGNNRTFAMRDGAACPLPPPPAYSEDVASAFYKEAFEVYETVKTLTPEQRAIARFWSDDPDAVPDAARSLARHRAVGAGGGECGPRTLSRSSGPSWRDPRRCLHRLLEEQVRIRSACAPSPTSAA